jgi:hypothetical protein
MKELNYHQAINNSEGPAGMSIATQIGLLIVLLRLQTDFQVKILYFWNRLRTKSKSCNSLYSSYF